jgi:hypothetical protein
MVLAIVLMLNGGMNLRLRKWLLGIRVSRLIPRSACFNLVLAVVLYKLISLVSKRE